MSSDSFATADRAALRRMAPEQPPPLVFYRFGVRYLPDGWERTLDDWVTLVAALAIMAPHAFRPDRGLGQALAEATYSEARLERLLAAQGQTRRILLLRAARFLAAKSAPCNWTDGAQLLFSRAPDVYEAICLRIARDFYRTAAAQHPPTP
jgi:CRISPR system Cascade subunit CasB